MLDARADAVLALDRTLARLAGIARVVERFEAAAHDRARARSKVDRATKRVHAVPPSIANV